MKRTCVERLGAVVVVAVLLMWQAPIALAQMGMTTDYSGDLWTRPALTGDWGGLRNDLAKKGMNFDLTVTQIYAGVANGGRDTGFDYAGRGDFWFNLDTQKAGLWPGGFFALEAEADWGITPNRRPGSILPMDSSELFPLPGNDNNIDLPNVSYTQFLSPHIGFFLGKLATITNTSGDMNEFAHGKGEDNFMNTAFNVNSVALLMPYSALGAGAIILPGKTPEDMQISLCILDAEGNPNLAGFNTVFKGGTIYAGEARIRTGFFGMTGHQLVGGIYSDKLYKSLDSSLRLIIDNRGLANTSGSWSVYYNFDQYFYEPVKGSSKGMGLFGRFGATDDHVLPLQFFTSIGVGGKGMIDARPNDSFGLGYYYVTTSNAHIPSRLGLEDEQGIEAFYNIAITTWAHLTADVQYLDGALPRSSSALVLGMRLKLRF